MESTKVILRNVREQITASNQNIFQETDPVKARQRWREIMGRVRTGIGRMDDGFTYSFASWTTDK